MRQFFSSLRVALATVACAALTPAASAMTWDVVYDQTSITTRSLRGLAVSPDGSDLYGGFIRGSSTAGFQHFTLTGNPPVGTPAGFFNVTSIGPSGENHQAEAVVIDDRGLVFGASIKDSTSGDNARIIVMDSTLGTYKMVPLADITAGTTGETIGGLTFRTDGTNRQLYVTRFRDDTAYIERYTIGGSGVGDATVTLDPTFNGTGQLNLRSFSGYESAANLRGIDVTADGTILVASREGNVVYRISADLSDIQAISVANAMDVAIYGGNAYVTTYAGADSQIVEIDIATGALTGTTFTATDLFSRGDDAGYAGIAFDALGRMYVVDQFYAGTNDNVSDRILVSSPIPEPSAAMLLAAGPALMFLHRQRLA